MKEFDKCINAVKNSQNKIKNQVEKGHVKCCTVVWVSLTCIYLLLKISIS